MASPSLADLTVSAAAATEPSFVLASTPKFGGVDPLGLRQINFDLMDQVLPGLNNVARHIRPFVVVAWAWRRAKQIAETLGTDEVRVDDLQDFVDRIEVIYAWSQLLRNPEADLPGNQVLAPLTRAQTWRFGGDSWRKRRAERRDSTAFTAAINYGPGLKSFGWLAPHKKHAGVLMATDASTAALDAFEVSIGDLLSHPAFARFGDIEVTAQEAKDWADKWALDQPTEAEKRVMAQMLCGSMAPLTRRDGCALMLSAVADCRTADAARVRQAMAGAPSSFAPRDELEATLHAWRRIQVRQLFRLSLEALFYWVLLKLEGGPRSTESLVEEFLEQAGQTKLVTASEWLASFRRSEFGPVELMRPIENALASRSYATLPVTIAEGLSFSIAEAPEHGQFFERADRLPLSRVRREAKAWAKAPATSFIRHVFESWVLAQHVYWAVGRGLADARARGKTILRLKVILEEGGWTLAPGTSAGNPPVPTPDRLETALRLATECGLVVLPT